MDAGHSTSVGATYLAVTVPEAEAPRGQPDGVTVRLAEAARRPGRRRGGQACPGGCGLGLRDRDYAGHGGRGSLAGGSDSRPAGRTAAGVGRRPSAVTVTESLECQRLGDGSLSGYY
jgi:hypothetical protein